MLPITNPKTPLPDRSSLDALRIKDAYLRNVLEGRAYLVFDGAMGTMMQARGLATGNLPELLCFSQPQQITDIHRAYVEAGSHVVTTNTFGANARKLEGAVGPDGSAVSIDDVFHAAISCARASGARYVAADIGPIGALLEPMGALSFEDAYSLFAEQARAAQAHGADIIAIETMTDLLEMKAAVLAAKEETDLPIIATMTFDETGRTFLGTSPAIAAEVLDSLGVQALGVNCSLGPDSIAPLVADMLATTSLPVVVQANAGLPRIEHDKTVYSVSPADYAAAVRPMIDAGATILGGCCGTSPEYIKLLAAQAEDRVPHLRKVKRSCTVTSAQRSVALRGHDVAVIGERINPTGKKKLQAALREGDIDYVLGEAIAQTQAGADVLDVNVGMPGMDEVSLLRTLVTRIQGASPLPLQIDSSNPAAVEAAVRVYAGKPLVNSVNGKAASLACVLPIVKHYGCAVVGLTLDEDGIPPTAEGRFAIACAIVDAAERAGIPRHDVLIDCLVMSASTNQSEIPEILRAVTLVKRELGVRTVLGVSNVSFGLPARPVVNATFLAAAFAAGLDMPILNPLEQRYGETVASWRVLNAQDAGAFQFIEDYANWTQSEPGMKQSHATDSPTQAPAQKNTSSLFDLVVSGDRGPVPSLVDEMLETSDAVDIMHSHLIPALDEVGRLFESGEFFLPQLIFSADAAKAAFDRIKLHNAHDSSSRADGYSKGRGAIALATVEGDIHDIGKNIVAMLLENYGYEVHDLGRDVAPQAILDYVLEHDVKIVGLSALMTTTLPSMEKTVALLRQKAPDVKIMVGGAVVTQAYADSIGADFYAKNATEDTRFAAQVFA